MPSSHRAGFAVAAASSSACRARQAASATFKSSRNIAPPGRAFESPRRGAAAHRRDVQRVCKGASHHGKRLILMPNHQKDEMQYAEDRRRRGEIPPPCTVGPMGVRFAAPRIAGIRCGASGRLDADAPAAWRCRPGTRDVCARIPTRRGGAGPARSQRRIGDRGRSPVTRWNPGGVPSSGVRGLPPGQPRRPGGIVRQSFSNRQLPSLTTISSRPRSSKPEWSAGVML